MPPLPLNAIETVRGSQTHRAFGLVSFGHATQGKSAVMTSSTLGTARTDSSKASKRYQAVTDEIQEDEDIISRREDQQEILHELI